MLKCVIQNESGDIYLFGLSETDLNRMEFNKESILFNFGYVNRPDLYGAVLYLNQFFNWAEAVEDLKAVYYEITNLYDKKQGINAQTLKPFIITRDILRKLRNTPFWTFKTHLKSTKSNDVQMFFAADDEVSMMERFRKEGLI